MALKETVAYYVQNQNTVFCTFLDYTKAFHRVNYCKLFKLLVKRELPVLIMRVLANLNMNNLVRVCWGGAMTISQLSTELNGMLCKTLFFIACMLTIFC